MTTREHGQEIFGLVTDALQLIEQNDRSRFESLQANIRRIALVDGHGTAGEYWAHARAIALDAEHVRRQVPAAVAMTIVHEAMHAALERNGARFSDDREQAERACVDAEISFAQRLPGTEPLVEGAIQKLATRWWEDAPSKERAARRLHALRSKSQ